jgi:chromosome segregation ATPase
MPKGRIKENTMSTHAQIFNALSDAIACANREPELLAKIKTLTDDLELARMEIDDKQRQMDELSARYNDLYIAHNELSIDHERLQADHEALNKTLDDNEAIIRDQEGIIIRQKDEFEYQGRLIAELRAEMCELQAKLDASNGLGTRLQTILNRIMGEAKEAIATLPASEVAAASMFLGSEPVEGNDVSSESLVEPMAEKVMPSFAHHYIEQVTPGTPSPAWKTPACEWDSSTL